MKKLSTVLLLALVALTACAWTAKGTGTQPAESKPTEPPAVAAVAVQPPAPEPEPKEPEWIEYEATAYCSCEKCCGSWALNRPDGIVYTASGAVAEQGVTIAADWTTPSPWDRHLHRRPGRTSGPGSRRSHKGERRRHLLRRPRRSPGLRPPGSPPIYY